MHTADCLLQQVGKDMEAQAFLGRLDSDPTIGEAFVDLSLDELLMQGYRVSPRQRSCT